MSLFALLVECCELFTGSAWNEYHNISSSILVHNFKPAPFLKLKSVLIFPSSAAVFTVRPCTCICVGKLAAINYKHYVMTEGR